MRTEKKARLRVEGLDARIAPTSFVIGTPPMVVHYQGFQFASGGPVQPTGYHNPGSTAPHGGPGQTSSTPVGFTLHP